MASRWDRDRFAYERDRYPDDRPPRFDDRDDDYYPRPPPPAPRDRSVDSYNRSYRGDFDDDFVRDRPYYDHEPRYVPRREPEREFDRRVFFEKERDVDFRSPSPQPARRPNVMLRRQSSLDTFDRRPAPAPPLHFLNKDHPREDYGQLARRDDFRREREDYRRDREEFRAPPYVPIPLPRSRERPPNRRHYEEIQVADPGHYGDEEFRAMPERVREREVYRGSRRTRGRSRESRSTRTYSTTSRTSSTSSRSSSSSGGTTIRNEYPKKGKTRIPARLVSKRALIELGYPYTEEGNTVIVLKALGQENIDELLKLSEDFKKSELELAAARSAAGNIMEERREEIAVAQAPPPAPAVVVDAPPPANVEIVNKTVVREPSPSRSTTSYTTSSYPSTYYDRREDELPVAVVRHRSASRSRRDIRAEIRALEDELRDTRVSRRHHHHYRLGSRDGAELVRAERLPDGALVLEEEKVEKVEEGYRGVRIEKDRKGPPPALMRAMLATLT